MSTLLDELLIRISTDTSNADKNLDRTNKKTDKLGSSFASLAARAAGALTAILSVSTAINSAISRAADIEALDRTAKALGLGITELDAFGKAAERMGGDVQGARDSLTDMAESIGEGLQDVESQRAKTFAALGISLRGVNGQAKDAITGILELAGAVEKMSKEEAIFRIKELGITDNRTVEMVLKGRKELELMLKVQKEGNAVTKEQAERAKAFNESMIKLRMTLTAGANTFFDSIIPALKVAVDWLDKMANWVGDNEHLVTGFFGAIAAVITTLYLPTMISAAIATIAATWPILAIIALVTAAAAAFALLYDDVMNFIEGNDSFIGQIFDKYPMVKSIIFSIIDAFKFMGSELLGVFRTILDGWNGIFEIIMSGIDSLVSGFKSVGGIFGFSLWDNDSVSAAQAHMSNAAASPFNSLTSSAITNMGNSASETNVPIGNISIYTQSTDGSGIGRDIGRSLTDQLRDLDAQTATGVAR